MKLLHLKFRTLLDKNETASHPYKIAQLCYLSFVEGEVGITTRKGVKRTEEGKVLNGEGKWLHGSSLVTRRKGICLNQPETYNIYLGTIINGHTISSPR